MSKQLGPTAGAVRVGPVRRTAQQNPSPPREAQHQARRQDSAAADREDHRGGRRADAPPPRRASSRSGARGRGRILRIGLPLTALAMIAAVFWLSRPSYQAPTFDLIDGLKLQAGMELENPHYIGATANDEPYEIRAAAARPDGPDPEQIALDQVTGDITLKDGKAATLVASEGVWIRSSNRLRLSGGVVMKLSDGYEMETEALLASIDEREVVTDGHVKGIGPVGTLEAGRGRFQDVDSGVAWFEDGVKVRITKMVKSRATGE